MIPGGLPMPLPAPSLACPRHAQGGHGLRPFTRGIVRMCVQPCSGDLAPEQPCTLVELCMPAPMGPWVVGGIVDRPERAYGKLPAPMGSERGAVGRAIFSTLRSLKAPSGSCRAGRPFQTSTPRLLHRPGSSP